MRKISALPLIIITILTFNSSASYCDDFKNALEGLKVIYQESKNNYHTMAEELIPMLQNGQINTTECGDYSNLFTKDIAPFLNDLNWLICLAEVKYCIAWKDYNKKSKYINILTVNTKEVRERISDHIKFTDGYIQWINRNYKNRYMLQRIKIIKNNMSRSLALIYKLEKNIGD